MPAQLEKTEGVELVAVCDANLRKATSFAARWGISKAFDSLASMLRNQTLDAIHVLAPPDQHHLLAKTALPSIGNHVRKKRFLIAGVRVSS
jgi:predicted dehydrogenase